jgi:hypothetical protein
MSKQVFTPGPWMVDDRASTRIRDNADTTIASAGMASRILEESQANARLIAAAPDLYEALKEAEQDFLDLNEYWNGGNGSAVDACQHTCEVTEKALDKVRAALTKAVKP